MKILSKIKESYLLIILDDLFICSKVNNLKINNYFSFMKKNSIHHLSMVNLKKSIAEFQEEFVILQKGEPYRINVFGFWNKEVLKNLLIPGENPWNFEIMGSYRSSYSDGYLSFINSPLKVMNMVEKGKIFKEAIKFAKLQKLNLDLTKREVIKNKLRIKSLIQIGLFKIILLLPWKLRLKFMNIIRKLMVCY